MGKLLSTRELAEYLGISLRTLQRVLKEEPDFPKYRVGRQLRFDPEEVKEFLKEREAPAGEAAPPRAGPRERPQLRWQEGRPLA
jgi:excisionase family DNA binding protein